MWLEHDEFEDRLKLYQSLLLFLQIPMVTSRKQVGLPQIPLLPEIQESLRTVLAVLPMGEGQPHAFTPDDFCLPCPLCQSPRSYWRIAQHLQEAPQDQQRLWEWMRRVPCLPCYAQRSTAGNMTWATQRRSTAIVEMTSLETMRALRGLIGPLWQEDQALSSWLAIHQIRCKMEWPESLWEPVPYCLLFQGREFIVSSGYLGQRFGTRWLLASCLETIWHFERQSRLFQGEERWQVRARLKEQMMQWLGSEAYSALWMSYLSDEQAWYHYLQWLQYETH